MEILDFNKLKIPKKEMGILENTLGDNLTFASLDDKFRFTCTRCKSCCRRRPGEADFTIPALLPYDVIRLSRSLKITTTEFLKQYTKFDLYDSVPLMAPYLKYISDEKGMRCPFLSDSGCSVHEDKPMICRLYPLVKVDYKIGTFIVLRKKLYDCPGGSGQEHTVRSWLDESGVHDHFKHDKLWDLFFSMDIKKFLSLPDKYQQFFYAILYDIDWILVEFEYDGLSDPAEEVVDVCYDFCRRFLKKYDCLEESESKNNGAN